MKKHWLTIRNTRSGLTKMKITRRQLRRIIKETITTVSDEDFDRITMPGYKGPQPQPAKPQTWRLPYTGVGYRGRRIISRDRAWLEFIPAGSNPSDEHMFQAVTRLEADDPEVQRRIEKGPNPKSVEFAKAMNDLSLYDIYSVYRTTSG
jgi:hypothetical protein